MPEDEPYLQQLKRCVGTASVSVLMASISTLAEVRLVCEKRFITGVISTSQPLLQKLVESQSVATTKVRPSISNYAGSLFTLPNSTIEVVFISPLEQLITVSYGAFLATRYISKLTSPNKWPTTTKFNWSVFHEKTIEDTISRFANATAIAIDIETFKAPPSIRCVGYTAIFLSNGNWGSESLVIPCTSMFNLSYIRRLNALPIDKIFQNGKYDISYLQAYNAAPTNYFWDTAECFHSWYSELPKDLASLNAFFVRDSMYWKDLAKTNDLQTYYLYNAKDTWVTAHAFLAWIAESPQWAKDNYANTFPLQYPCHLSEMTGIAMDMVELDKAYAEQEATLAGKSLSVDTMLGVTNFNVASPIQMKQLLHVLGCKDLDSADEKNLKKASLAHPLNGRILGKILEIRKSRKLISTYLKKGKEFNGHLAQKPVGRILYSLNPHGTDTGRLASKEHHFWCGLQIQNIPRGRSVKRTLVADTGFRIYECDLEQAESRDTAYVSGDEKLIAAVSGDRDFHSVNASAFFGIPYDQIYSDKEGRVLLKPVRQLAKNVNHGANYLMGPGVLIDTMGEDRVREASRLLKLPKLYTPKRIAEHLLAQFHKTYPKLSSTFYPGVMAEVKTTHMLSSKATHDCPYQAVPSRGLVRYCFGDPSKSKSDLNAHVAHVPQSLNAMTLNRAYMKVFYEIALHPEHRKNFKLLAQIHDSILFQVRVGHEYIAEWVKESMEIPVRIKAYDGVTRNFTVPAATKGGRDGKGAERWSDTE